MHEFDASCYGSFNHPGAPSLKSPYLLPIDQLSNVQSVVLNRLRALNLKATLNTDLYGSVRRA